MKVAMENKHLADKVSLLLDELAAYGAEPGGGVTRLLYDQAWREARLALAERMARLGLEVSVDRTGNTFGRLTGTGPNAEDVIAIGSHLDTVRNGGRFDGAYGISAGLAAVDVLYRAYGPPKKSIEVAAFCEEEGSRFPLVYWGSGSVAGARVLSDAAALEDPDGILFTDAMREAGFGRDDQPVPGRPDWIAFLELHIEQGPVLEALGVSVGIAEAIVGQKRYAIRLIGESNHAGTTPMGMRRDAMAGAAAMVLALEKLALRYGPPMVATAGRLEAYPNTPNVVPGEVVFTADIRHPNGGVLERFCREMEAVFGRIAGGRGLGMAVSLWVDADPVPMDPGLAGMAEAAAAEEGLACIRMPSGAGHDAQMLQAVCPSLLVFVPSRSGISHSPLEYTEPAHLADGVRVMINLLYKLAYEERTPWEWDDGTTI